jgi:aspartate/methionine/tyrosine aminotransferase
MKRFIEKISPFIVMDILAKARTMPDAVHMEVGEPDIPPSEKVKEAYIRAIKDNKFHYTPAKGLKELRERIAEFYHERYKVSVSAERIIITPGTSGAFMVVFALLTGTQKRLLLSDPSYPCYKNFAYFLETEPVFIPVGKDTHYEILPEEVENVDNIGALVASSPANPVGNVCREETIKAGAYGPRIFRQRCYYQQFFKILLYARVQSRMDDTSGGACSQGGDNRAEYIYFS